MIKINKNTNISCELLDRMSHKEDRHSFPGWEKGGYELWV